jgi:hypothetical protein
MGFLIFIYVNTLCGRALTTTRRDCAILKLFGCASHLKSLGRPMVRPYRRYRGADIGARAFVAGIEAGSEIMKKETLASAAYVARRAVRPRSHPPSSHGTASAQLRDAPKHRSRIFAIATYSKCGRRTLGGHANPSIRAPRKDEDLQSRSRPTTAP